jgi:hypothetical protein
MKKKSTIEKIPKANVTKNNSNNKNKKKKKKKKESN